MYNNIFILTWEASVLMLVTCSTHPFVVSSFSFSLALYIVFSTHIHTHIDPDYSVPVWEIVYVWLYANPTWITLTIIIKIMFINMYSSQNVRLILYIWDWKRCIYILSCHSFSLKWRKWTNQIVILVNVVDVRRW